MNAKTAQSVGRKYAFWAAATIFAIYELVGFIIEFSKGSATGLAFFEEQLTISALAMFSIHFFIFLLIGSFAGYFILVKHRNSTRVGLYAALGTTAIVVSFMIMRVLPVIRLQGIYDAAQKRSLITFSTVFCIALSFVVFTAWLFVVRLIARKKIVD